MNRYVRVMDGLKLNARGEKFKLDEIITAKIWNPKGKDSETMGGFNFSTNKYLGRNVKLVH